MEAARCRLYVDGQLDGSIAFSTPMTQTSAVLRIGKNNYLYGPLYFNGLIDEVRVSNAAVYTGNFTPQEHLTASGSTMGLWKFDNQTTSDSSGNGNNGTPQGGATYSSDVPGGGGGGGGSEGGGGEGGGGGGASSSIQWLVTDHLGTPRMIFDQTGSLANMKRHDYLPFGEELFAGVGGRTVAQGYAGGDGVRQQFTLKERDNETGLDYFLARYYSSSLGRFTSPDEFSGGPRELFVLGGGNGTKQAVPYAEITQPQSLNKYTYVYNSPCRFTDPDGHCGTPSGLKQGDVGICVASYIKSTFVPPGSPPGRGDGRGPNGQGGTSRIEVRVVVDLNKGTVKKTDEAMGRSGTIFKELGPKGGGGVQVSSPPGRDEKGNLYFQINQHGTSKILGMMGSIDNHLNMVVTTDGRVGITPSSTAQFSVS